MDRVLWSRNLMRDVLRQQSDSAPLLVQWCVVPGFGLDLGDYGIKSARKVVYRLGADGTRYDFTSFGKAVFHKSNVWILLWNYRRSGSGGWGTKLIRSDQARFMVLQTLKKIGGKYLRVGSEEDPSP